MECKADVTAEEEFDYNSDKELKCTSKEDVERKDQISPIAFSKDKEVGFS